MSAHSHFDFQHSSYSHINDIEALSDGDIQSLLDQGKHCKGDVVKTMIANAMTAIDGKFHYVDNLESMSGQEIQSLYRAGICKPSDVVKTIITNICTYDRRKYINSMAFTFYSKKWQDSLLQQGEQMDILWKGQQGSGAMPLLGIPMTIKDNINVAGIETMCGTQAFRHYVPERDAPVISLLKNAGAIIIGKAQTTELNGYLDLGDGSTRPIGGATYSSRTKYPCASGSSCGSAVAASAYGLPSICTDTFGSIHNPARRAGVYGMKFSAEALPQAGVLSLCPQYDGLGIMAPYASDLAAIYSAIVPTETSKCLYTKGTERHTVKAAILLKPEDVIDTSFKALGLMEVNFHTDKIPTNTIRDTWYSTAKDGLEAWLRECKLDGLETLADFTSFYKATPAVSEAGKKDLLVLLSKAKDWSACLEYDGLRSIFEEDPDVDVVIYHGYSDHGHSAFANHEGYPTVTVPVGWNKTENEPDALYMSARKGKDQTLLKAIQDLEDLNPDRAQGSYWDSDQVRPACNALEWLNSALERSRLDGSSTD